MATWYFNSSNGVSRYWFDPANWTSTEDGTGTPGTNPASVPWIGGTTNYHADDLRMGTAYPSVAPVINGGGYIGGNGSSQDSPPISGACHIAGVTFDYSMGGYICGGTWMEPVLIDNYATIYGGTFHGDTEIGYWNGTSIYGGLFLGDVIFWNGYVTYDPGWPTPVFMGSVDLSGNYGDIECGYFHGDVVLQSSAYSTFNWGSGTAGNIGPVLQKSQALTFCGYAIKGGVFKNTVTTAGSGPPNTIEGGVFYGPVNSTSVLDLYYVTGGDFKSSLQVDGTLVMGGMVRGNVNASAGTQLGGNGLIVLGDVNGFPSVTGSAYLICTGGPNSRANTLNLNSVTNAVVVCYALYNTGTITEPAVLYSVFHTLAGDIVNGSYPYNPVLIYTDTLSLSGTRGFTAGGVVIFGSDGGSGGTTAISSGTWLAGSGFTSNFTGLNISGGIIDASISSNVLLTVTGGTFLKQVNLRTQTVSGNPIFTGNVTTASASTVVISSGTFLGAFTTGGSTSNTTVNGGTFSGNFAGSTGSVITVNAGNFLGNFTGGGSSTVSLAGGLFKGTVTGTTMTATVSGGTFLNTTTLTKCAGISGSPIFAGPSSTITASGTTRTITGGYFLGNGASTYTITAGASQSWSDVSGVTCAAAMVFSNSSSGTVAVSAGTFLGATTLTKTSTGSVTVSGGTFRNAVTNTLGTIGGATIFGAVTNTGTISSTTTIYAAATNSGAGTNAAKMPLDVMGAGL